MPSLANIFNTDRKLAAIPNAGVLLQPTSLAVYRAQTGATFAKWMGASTSDLTTVFPNLGRFARAKGMGFLA